jgi:cytochrome c-type biogenesis protein CcmH/NrfG
LVGRGAHLDSLAHFEPLINASYELETVIGELTKVVAAQAKSPRARRLLGDAYMRRGDLQKALDTYRSALDQL